MQTHNVQRIDLANWTTYKLTLQVYLMNETLACTIPLTKKVNHPVSDYDYNYNRFQVYMHVCIYVIWIQTCILDL